MVHHFWQMYDDFVILYIDTIYIGIGKALWEMKSSLTKGKQCFWLHFIYVSRLLFHPLGQVSNYLLLRQ